ncbi:MAG: RraA family protein [Clostridiales bacterium]|nr:RraA family protein [Clostridiales bacterium]MCI7703095.1 RraA family protein [Clostridiales bacterium]MDY4541211.1 RraA family protein [Candidatus Ventricola sp.]
MINTCAPLLPDEVIRRAERLNVPLILDGVKAAKIDIPNGGCMDMEIMPVERGMTVVGTAMTVETANGDNFPIHVASYSVQEDGYVMVIDGKGYTGRAYFGDLIMGACQAAGFKGMVIDGCTRDRDGNIELGFPVYSRGFMPRGPIKKDEGNINTPIMCGGVRVEPGDLVVGDSDGVCVIPKAHIDVVLAEAEKKLAYEEKRTATIAAYRKAKAEGTELPQLAPQWVLDMLSAQ